MGIKTFHLLLLIMVLGNFSLFSQDIQRKERTFDHFLEIGFGANYHAARDEATSPLIYKGSQPLVHLQYFFVSPKFLGIIDENFSYGRLVSRNFSTQDPNKAISYNNNFSFSYYYKLKSYEKASFFVGGELGTLIDVRVNDKFNNADINYEIMASLSPAAMFEYRTSWRAGRFNLGLFSVPRRDRDFKIQYAVSLPVLTSILRPGYVTVNDFVDDNSLTLNPKDVQYTSFNKLFGFNSRVNVYYILHNNNMLKFNYTFSYFNFSPKYNPVKGFHSTLSLSIVFRFTNGSL